MARLVATRLMMATVWVLLQSAVMPTQLLLMVPLVMQQAVMSRLLLCIRQW
jgi:hypothetical protein